MRDEILERIEQRLSATGLSAFAASQRAGLSGDAIRNLRRAARKDPGGGRGGISVDTLNALAPVLGTTVAWLLSGEGEAEAEGVSEARIDTKARGMVAVPELGLVEAGAYRVVDDFNQAELPTFAMPPDEMFPSARLVAFLVAGDSMNALKPRPILPGDRVVCVSYEDVAHRVVIRDGMTVVVQRTRDGGHTREWSVKQVELYEDRTEFHPRSSNPRHKPIVVTRDVEADDGTQVEIIALVRRIVNDVPLAAF